MPSLLELALAGLLSTGSHALGHVKTGAKEGVPVKINYKDFTETWDTDSLKKDLKINGGGFRGQDALSRFTDTKKLAKSTRIINGLYKLAYLLDAPTALGVDTKGDIDNMGKHKKAMQASVFASALSDLHKSKNPDRKWDLDLWQSKDGVPGIKIRWKDK